MKTNFMRVVFLIKSQLPLLKQPIFRLLIATCCLALLSSCGIKKSLNNRPNLAAYNSQPIPRTQINDTTFRQGKNTLVKNEYGLWELYVEGNPLQRGLAIGNLTKELYYHQERVFLEKINALVPSEGQQKFLTKFLKWYNRKMYKHIPEEYKAEIYGVSRYASSEFNELAPPYLRALYLHGAHDIGHALQDLMLVGCTSFAVWNENTEDGKLLLGRNFDFYAGDAFAEEKIVAFIRPDTGYPFMSVTWGGFIGVVSGMNNQGLTVTINAGKSKIPLAAKTPISIVTREILQYASTIEEAVAIAKQREVFVSESILIGSANDRRAAIIEVSPNNLGVFEVKNQSQLICANHFQSDAFVNDRKNIKTIAESHTAYRFERMEQLIASEEKINPTEAVAILRNREGLNDAAIGYGNEKALNQLLAHHGIVFQPEDRKVWVSSNPYQMGAFVMYDLNTIFGNGTESDLASSFSKPDQLIPASPFLKTEAFRNYEAYRVLEGEIEKALTTERVENLNWAEQIVALNPDYWKAHYLSGRLYYEQGAFKKAAQRFTEALQKEIPSQDEVALVQKFLRKAKRKSAK